MFKRKSMKQTIEQLTETISKLTEHLENEQQAHANDRAELDRLQHDLALENQTTAEIQSALRKKLQELNEKAEKDDIDRQAAIIAFQAETADKRALLEQELRQHREEKITTLDQQIQMFWNCYNTYLLQIQQAIDQLNKTALAVGQTILDGDVDIAAAFQKPLQSFPFVTTGSRQESDASDAIPAEQHDPASESAASPQSAEEASGADVPFFLREDVPANITE